LGSKNTLLAKVQAKARALKYELSALYLAYKRKDTPVLAKVMIMITIVYGLSPIDLIPDCIPVLGYLDDLVVLPILISLSLRFLPKEILDECREQAKDLWKAGKPKKWYYAMPIVILYLVIILILIKNIFFNKR
jgi:uncharacterized membrane protein YkvA (DUF1232 family)